MDRAWRELWGVIMPKRNFPTRPIGLRANAFHRYKVTFDLVTTAPVMYMLTKYYEETDRPVWHKFLYMIRLLTRHRHGDNEMVVYDVTAEEAELK